MIVADAAVEIPSHKLRPFRPFTVPRRTMTLSRLEVMFGADPSSSLSSKPLKSRITVVLSLGIESVLHWYKFWMDMLITPLLTFFFGKELQGFINIVSRVAKT